VHEGAPQVGGALRWLEGEGEAADEGVGAAAIAQAPDQFVAAVVAAVLEVGVEELDIAFEGTAPPLGAIEVELEGQIGVVTGLPSPAPQNAGPRMGDSTSKVRS